MPAYGKSLERLVACRLAQLYPQGRVSMEAPDRIGKALLEINDGSEEKARNHLESISEFQGKDKKWVWAKAKIVGGKVVVWSEEVASPTSVRYGWANNPIGNLNNAGPESLPSGPFRTDVGK